MTQHQQTQPSSVVRFTTSAAVILLCTLSASSASADEAAKMRKQIEEYTLRLADLEKADPEKHAIQDIKLAQTWLNEAQVQLGREEEKRAGLQLRKVAVAVDLISTTLQRKEAEKKANDREDQAAQAERDADEAGLKLEEARARKKELQTTKP